MSPKNILIVCWDFPPHNSIGGRRWAKIAKSFLKLGHNLFVIHAAISKNKESNAWISAQDLSKIKRYGVSRHFLVNWLNDYQSKFGFIKIRIAKILLRSLFNGTIFDKAIGIKKGFVNLAEQVILDNKIEMVFVTGTPFNLLYYTAVLKENFKGLKIIADYRDPWLHAQNYGMSNLSSHRMLFEQQKQNYVFEHVDFVTAPNTFLLNEIKDGYTGEQNELAQFLELPHAFDPDDVINETTDERNDQTIKLIYAGTLYLGCDDYLKILNEAIGYLKTKQNNKKVELSFYTFQKEQAFIFENNSDVVKFYGAIGAEVFQIARRSDFILILLSEHNKNYVTSKFYEFLPYKKPYIYIGPEGVVSKKIKEEGLGYCIETKEDLWKIITQANKLTPTAKTIESYSFDAVTKNLLQALG
jgi:hypothetical protein